MFLLLISAAASAIVDNIPFVTTMPPLIKNMAASFGGTKGLVPMWWSLVLGACPGGNGSLVGASDNLIVAGFAERPANPLPAFHAARLPYDAGFFSDQSSACLFTLFIIQAL